MSYQSSLTVDLPYAEAVTRMRQPLAEQGFGSRPGSTWTPRDKRWLEMQPYITLGASNPDLTPLALAIDRSVGV